MSLILCHERTNRYLGREIHLRYYRPCKIFLLLCSLDRIGKLVFIRHGEKLVSTPHRRQRGVFSASAVCGSYKCCPPKDLSGNSAGWVLAYKHCVLCRMRTSTAKHRF